VGQEEDTSPDVQQVSGDMRNSNKAIKKDTVEDSQLPCSVGIHVQTSCVTEVRETGADSAM